MTRFQIHSPDDLAALVDRFGFLPFFPNEIPGFSVAEHTPKDLWFSKEIDGPWEWKGPAIRQCGGAYGKFFCSKAGFVSRVWFQDFANYRRDGYDFEGRFEDGFASYKDKVIFDVLEQHGEMLSKSLKIEAGRPKGFTGSLTRLQMQTYIITTDFVYQQDLYGRSYGWGIANYATPEAYFGRDFMDTAYERSPGESHQRIMEHLAALFPTASEAAIQKLIG